MSFKKILLGVYDSWCVVMDAKINPLKYLRIAAYKCFMIVLFIMGGIFRAHCSLLGRDFGQL